MRRVLRALGCAVVAALLTLTPAGALPSGQEVPRPDPQRTPGASDPAVTQDNIDSTICRSGYTRSVRRVTVTTRREVFAEYGISYAKHRDYEVDLLQRRHIHIEPDNIVWVGKEAGELTGMPTAIGDDLGDIRSVYGSGALNRIRLRVLNTMNKSRLAERVGVDRGTIRRVLKGVTRKPGHELENKLTFEAHVAARQQLRARGVSPPRSEFDCLGPYVSMASRDDR